MLVTSKENWQLGPWHVYYGLLEFTRPDNLRTALGLALLVATPLVIRLWLSRPRLQCTVWRPAAAADGRRSVGIHHLVLLPGVP